MSHKHALLAFLTGLTLMNTLLLACSPDSVKSEAEAASRFPVHKSEAEWQKLLPAETFAVMRQHKTERPFRHPYDKNKADGIYYCAACGQKLFDAKHKFDSGTGWPSFYQTMGGVGEKADHSLWMKRTEVHCSRCGGHLGHVFDDGPKPTGLRYCINAAALQFKARHVPPPALRK